MSLSKENKVIIDGQTYYGGLNQPPKFVKVNVDCWEKIFDYLALRDIVSLSQTCQRIRQIGGYYFRENFHGTKCWLHKDSIPLISTRSGQIKLKRYDFLRFVDSVEISGDLEHLKHYSSMDLLGSVTTLHLIRVDLHANAIGNFERSVMDNIETVELTDCKILNGSDGQLFASCPKLKCLRIKFGYRVDINLFRYTFPELEHFEYTGHREPASLFTSFLERNSSIKSLQIDDHYLLKIGLNTSTVQLDCLIIEINRSYELANRLKVLNGNGFYKKLNLSLGSDNYEMFIDELRSFGALEVLRINDYYANIFYLTELKELHLLGDPVRRKDLESIARNLTKLERLWICGPVEHLIPFLRNSKALEVAVLQNYDNNPLNLFDLNQMRRMGGSQRKVSMGVREDQYLATKWKSENVKYDLVEITRVETIRERFEYQRL